MAKEKAQNQQPGFDNAGIIARNSDCMIAYLEKKTGGRIVFTQRPVPAAPDPVAGIDAPLALVKAAA